MEKRTKSEVEGYLHKVSEVIQGKNQTKFFSAVLQENKRNTRVVVFDVQRHHMYRTAETDK